MSDKAGERWTVVAGGFPTITEPHPEKTGWTIARPGEPTFYAVVDQDWKNEQARFPAEEAAQQEAARLNYADVERERFTQDPLFVRRRARLRTLGETFWVRYGEGPIALRWPDRPDRYAVRVWSERYSESFWETHNPDDLEDEIRTGDVERIVDLDTDADVPFSVDISIAVGRSTAHETAHNRDETTP